MRAPSSTTDSADARTIPMANPVAVRDAHASGLADHTLAPDDAVRDVLGAIFRGDAAGRLFIVLRNGEDLPERQSGNDIDLSVRIFDKKRQKLIIRKNKIYLLNIVFCFEFCKILTMLD